jgi:hypothetical protein
LHDVRGDADPRRGEEESLLRRKRADTLTPGTSNRKLFSAARSPQLNPGLRTLNRTLNRALTAEPLRPASSTRLVDQNPIRRHFPRRQSRRNRRTGTYLVLARAESGPPDLCALPTDGGRLRHPDCHLPARLRLTRAVAAQPLPPSTSSHRRAQRNERGSTCAANFIAS